MSLEIIYFLLYTLFVVIIAAFFIIFRLHALKFKNFQTNIIIALRILGFSLLILAILGYVILFLILNKGNKTNIEKIDSSIDSQEVGDTIMELDEEIY